MFKYIYQTDPKYLTFTYKEEKNFKEIDYNIYLKEFKSYVHIIILNNK